MLGSVGHQLKLASRNVVVEKAMIEKWKLGDTKMGDGDAPTVIRGITVDIIMSQECYFIKLVYSLGILSFFF